MRLLLVFALLTIFCGGYACYFMEDLVTKSILATMLIFLTSLTIQEILWRIQEKKWSEKYSTNLLKHGAIARQIVRLAFEGRRKMSEEETRQTIIDWARKTNVSLKEMTEFVHLVQFEKWGEYR